MAEVREITVMLDKTGVTPTIHARIGSELADIFRRHPETAAPGKLVAELTRHTIETAKTPGLPLEDIERHVCTAMLLLFQRGYDAGARQ